MNSDRILLYYTFGVWESLVNPLRSERRERRIEACYPDRMKICPRCEAEHTKSGTYCSRSCANVRIPTSDSNAKRSKAAVENWKSVPKEERSNRVKPAIEASRKAYAEKDANTPFEEKTNWLRKREVFKEQGSCCLICGIKDWMGKKLTFELDHIDGDNTNNKRENLRVLCPNCHSQTDTWRGKNWTKDKRSPRNFAGEVLTRNEEEGGSTPSQGTVMLRSLVLLRNLTLNQLL